MCRACCFPSKLKVNTASSAVFLPVVVSSYEAYVLRLAGFRDLPALLIAMATACFGLYPSPRNIRMLLLTAFFPEPFLRGIVSPSELEDLEGVPSAVPLVPVVHPFQVVPLALEVA